MAVIDELPGVEVTITIDGKPLGEYEEPGVGKQPHIATRYIATQSAQIFEICIKIAQGTEFMGEIMSFNISVDGKTVSKPFVSKIQFARKDHTIVSRGQHDNDGKLYLFRFNALDIVDPDGKMFDHETEIAEDIGSVQVRVSFRNAGRRSIRKDSLVEEAGIASKKARMGRAISHGVGFTDAVQQVRPNAVYKNTLVDPERPVAATFVFRYRTLDGLKSELIIPRTPSPPPLEERDARSLSLEEMMEMQSQLRTFKRQATVKREIKEEEDRSAPPPRRKRHQTNAERTQLELGNDGNFREMAMVDLPKKVEAIIDLD